MKVNDIKLIDLYSVISSDVFVRFDLEGHITEFYFDIFDIPDYESAFVSSIDTMSEDCLIVRFFYYA